jgi:hypothetical protein
VSSELPEQQDSPEEDAPSRRQRRPYEKWRKIMIGGALLLLAIAVAKAITEVPRPVVNFGYMAGYAILAYGFFLSMRERRGIQAPPPKDEDQP